MFFHNLDSEKNRQIYTFNTKIRQKVTKFMIILLIPGFPFLWWGIMFASRSQHILGPITPQGLILNINAFIMLHFWVPIIVKTIKKEYWHKRVFMPSFRNEGLNVGIAVISLLTYLLLIPFYWIPNLPPNEQNNLQSAYGIPIFLISIISVVDVSFCFAVMVAISETLIIIDKDRQLCFLEGKDHLGRYLKMELPLSEALTVVLQPYSTNFDIEQLNKKTSTKKWGVFLYFESKQIKFFGGYTKKAFQFAEELTQHTGWSLSKKEIGIHMDE